MGVSTEVKGLPNDGLLPFLPRLTLEWLGTFPERRWLKREGTLAFVDISGFTAMSERLSSLGRAGAEEVTDVMNATFARLLAEAYSFGGGLLKFGGDALLLFFDGPDHALRASAASVALRDALAEIAHPETSAGTVELRMHVGVHTGDFLFFLVGDSHRELLVTGPGASRTVEMEATSEAGDILLSPATAAFVPAECLGESKGDGVLLVSRPAVAGEVEPIGAVSDLDLEQAIPAPLRAQLLQVGRLEGEHRNAAIGFIRFAGVDELLEERGADGVADALDAIVRTIQSAADEHLVTFLESDIDRDGGRIILVAGAPQTSGDDEARLLRTLRTVLDAPRPLPLHIGANRGRVFTGQVGAEFRRTYTVLGDTAALAARLMARAGDDQLLAADEIYKRATGHFQVSALEPFHVKGKAEPVQAYAIEAFADSPVQGPARPRLPFVDRERERAVLNAAVAPVRLGFGSFVELVGEPGLGKSRLTEELRSYCEDMPMLTASCAQYESATPYHPFRPLLRSILGVELNADPASNRERLADRLAQLDPELEPWSPLLAVPLDVDMESTPEVDELEPSFRRARLHGVVSAVLGKLLDRPTFILFEDVHWMDEASTELLRFLAGQLSTRPWLACATRRPGPGGFSATEGIPPVPALTLRLEPLPVDDARTLVRAAAGGELGDDDVAALLERGAGNPLFLQELAAAGASDSEELPETVEALLATRIDGLAPGDRTLLRWASVLGPSFHSSDVRAVLAVDESASTDDEAWDRLAEFVERDPHIAGGFRFRHALIRDAAYEGLSFRRRRELHGRVGDVLEERNSADPYDVAELLSLHFYLAGRLPETWRYSCEAGRRARAKWANRDAVELYLRAVDAAKEMPELDAIDVAGVWIAVADCLRLLSDFDLAAEALESARGLVRAGSPVDVHLMAKEGQLRESAGQYAEAIEWYEKGLVAAERLDSPEMRLRERLELNVGYAQTLFRQGKFQECIERCQVVVEDGVPIGDAKSLAPTYLLLHVVHTFLGTPEREAYRGLSLPLYEELGDLSGQASTLNNLGIESYYAGDWTKARDLYEQSRKLRERIGDVVSVAMTTNNIGEILSDQGQLDEARTMFEEVIASSEQVGQRLLATLARSNVGYVEARAGNIDEAAALLAEAVESFTELEATSFALETRVRQAEVAALAGNAEDALRLADEVLADAGDAAEMMALQSSAHRIRGAALALEGDRDAAGSALDKSISIAREGNATLQLALALDLLGRIDDDRDAASEAAELLAKLGVASVARPI